jgi:hypothetical protein
MLKNPIGTRFGKLVIVEQQGLNKRNEKLWLCKCDCGNTKIVKSYNLTSENTKSCGCIPTGHKSLDLTGQKFNFLTVISFDNTDKWRDYHYVCRCDCGNTTIVRRSHLINGSIKSCGCWHKNFRKNGYKDISGTYWSSIKNGAKSRNIEFNITKEYVWNIFINQNKKCVYTNLDITLQEKHFIKNQTASLDRIDSSKGYIEGNVQWVHKTINIMKSYHSEQEFLNWCKLVSQGPKNVKS